MLRRSFLLAAMILVGLLNVACEQKPASSVRETAPPVPRGDVPWLNPEDSSTWSGSEKPYFLFLHSGRSYWSHEMVRESFTASEAATEIARITRPVWVDADLRPDLVDRFALGGLPSVALLTPELNWITGTTFIGQGDLAALLRHIRILYDIPERSADLERERARLLDRRPVVRASIVHDLSLQGLRVRLADQMQRGKVRLSAESALFLLEQGGIETFQAWEESVRAGRWNGDGLLVTALLTPDSQVRDETTSLGINAGLLYAFARGATRTGNLGLRQTSLGLASAIVAALFVPGQDVFVSGSTDFSRSDSSGSVIPIVGRPPVFDARSITAFNALLVSGLCEVARLDSSSQIIDIARRTLDRLLSERVREAGVVRTGGECSVLQLEDAAHLIRACLDFGQLSGEDHYVQAARSLVEKTARKLPNIEVVIRPDSDLALVYADGDYGSGVGVFCQCLIRLCVLDKSRMYVEMAEALCREAVASNSDRPNRLGAVGRALALMVETQRTESD